MQDKGTWVLPGVLEGTRGSRVGAWLTPKVTQPRSDRAGRELRLLLPGQLDRKPGSEMEAAWLSRGSGVKKD